MARSVIRLRECLSLSSYWRGDWIVVIKGLFDESYNSNNPRMFLVGGIVAQAREWDDIENGWKSALDFKNGELVPKQASLKRDRGWRAFSHRRSFFACCFVPIVTTTCNEDRLRLLCFALLLCLSVFDAPLSPFFSFAPASRDIADALGHENLSSRIWSNVEKNVSRCLL